MQRIIWSVVVVAGCAVILAGCGGTSKTPVASSKIMVDVSEAQAANLTKDTQAKIKTGMTLDEVNTVVAPLLGQSGSVTDVKDDSVYEVGWQDPKTKKAIVVKFKGSKVIDTSTVNIP
jgi:hypothetical protein